MRNAFCIGFQVSKTIRTIAGLKDAQKDTLLLVGSMRKTFRLSECHLHLLSLKSLFNIEFALSFPNRHKN